MDERIHTFTAGALLPGLQSLLSGAFGALVIAGIIWLTGAEHIGAWLLMGGAVIAGLTWAVLLRRWVFWVDRRQGIVPAPRVQVLEPERQGTRSTVRVNVIEDTNGGYLRGQMIDLPCKPEQLKMLACSAIQGGSLGENAWTGRDRPFSKSEFHALRAELLARGWLAWRSPGSPSQGLEPTSAGRAVFGYLANGQATLPPPKEDAW